MNCAQKWIITKEKEIPKIPDPSIISEIYSSGRSRLNSAFEVNLPEYQKKPVMSQENIHEVLEHIGIRKNKNELHDLDEIIIESESEPEPEIINDDN